MGAFDSFLNRITKVIGGEDPPLKVKSAWPVSGKKVFTSQSEIQSANQWVRDMLARKNTPRWLVENTIVGRKVGDAIPQFEGDLMRQTPQRVTELPMGVTVNDVMNTNNGYGFFHPQSGNFIPVDPDAIYQKYGTAKK